MAQPNGKYRYNNQQRWNAYEHRRVASFDPEQKAVQKASQGLATEILLEGKSRMSVSWLTGQTVPEVRV